MKKYIRGRVQKTMAGFEEPAPTMKKKRKLSSTPAATSFSRAEDEGAGLLALVDAAKRKGPLTRKKQKTKSKKHANLKWTAEEDKKLAELVKQYECKQWKEVASHFPNRSATQCSQHWRKCADPQLKKNEKWSSAEDTILLQGRQKNPPLTFGEIATLIPGRTNIQCRNRWDNVVDPRIRTGPFSEVEDTALIDLRKQGYRWVDMPKHQALRNRSSVALKNRYRRLKSLNGIEDP